MGDVAFSATSGTQPRVSLLLQEGVSHVLDHAGLPPDLSLFVQSGDEVRFVCASVHPGCGWRGRSGLIYVVVHRSQGLWTHVYRVVQDPRRGKLAVFVEKVIAGDDAGAAAEWAISSFS